jgi:outer membrane receptor protein involved in Fe transport
VTNPPDRTEIVLSPRVGVVRSLGSLGDVHASGFRAFREPSMNELYRTGQVGQEITDANASLSSERATGWEIGAQSFATRRLPAAFHATCFWTEINRPVSAVLIAQTATTITNLRENLGQIRSRGVELSAELHPARALSATLGYQYADATVTKFSAQPSLVGNWIPQVPRHSFTSQLRASEKHLGELTVALRASGQAFDDADNQFPLAGFFELDVSGHRSLGRHLDANFLVQNVTDQRQQVARTPTLTLGSPIFAEAGLRLHWSRATP